MRNRLPLLSLLLLTACPVEVGQECPARTASVGQYALAFQGEHDAGECAALEADGGGPPTPVAADDGGTVTAALCYGFADAGPQLYLVIPGRQTRSSRLLADGGFHFTGHADPETGTRCGCPVGIDETFDGYLQSSPAGSSFALQADGGLPQVSGLAGVIADTFSTPPGTTGCLCNLPCATTFAITGTRR